MTSDTSDSSDASDVEMEDAPPNTWEHLSWWMQLSGRTQRDQPKWYPVTPKPGKCRAELTTAKDENQRSVLAYLRPVRWTKAPMELNLDVLEVVADAMMRTGDARTLRALAVVNRECAAAVRNTLRAACDKLRECAEEFAEAQDRWRLTLTYDGEDPSDEQLLREEAAEERRQEALSAYEECMRSTGIPMFRVQALARKPWSRWFHGSTSLLGHLQMGCELCSSEDNGRDTAIERGPCRCSRRAREAPRALS